MTHNQNIENQPRGQQMLPPQGPMLPPPPPRTWRERMMRDYGWNMHLRGNKGVLTIPSWLNGKCIVFFFIAMFACWVVFEYVPAFDLILTACISVVLFFYGGYTMAKSWRNVRAKQFLKYIFIAGFLIRLVWVIYCYFFFNMDHYGAVYGERADVEWYMPFAKDIAQWLSGELDVPFSQIIDINTAAIDDVGYPMWLGIIYFLTDGISDVFIPFCLKCVFSAYCAICIYHVAKRHFGEGTARMAAIFVCLNPNMIYWCGNMFKEAEMVFLCCLAADNFDRVLNSGKRYSFRALLPGILAGLALMFFRTVLGLVFFLAVFAHIVMASRRVMSTGKKIIAGVLVATVLLLSMGDRIHTQSQKLVEAAQSDYQKKDMEWRSKREGGNSFAKYASAAVFAPLIFTIPFPTFNQANESQLLQIQLSGGSYIKNILSFFVIFVMFIMLVSGEWRRHVFILAYTCGYLVVLVLSNFAQSGRFHMPVIPMLMLFAAYGVQLAKGNKKLQLGFTLTLVAEVAICLVWNWFKLKGRGMI